MRPAGNTTSANRLNFRSRLFGWSSIDSLGDFSVMTAIARDTCRSNTAAVWSKEEEAEVYKLRLANKANRPRYSKHQIISLSQQPRSMSSVCTISVYQGKRK